MAKTIKDLLDSRKQRAEMIEYFGFMPKSILKFSRGSQKIYNYQHETKENSVYYIKEDRLNISSIIASGRGSRGGDRYSIMPTSLVEFAIKYYYTPGDLYVDPFAGQGVRMQIAKKYNIDYIGYDVCEKFVQFMQSIKTKIDDQKTRLEIFLQDSKTIGDEAKDWGFCFTSPPYWDIEEYDNSPDQLGIGKTYNEFLEGITDVYSAMYKQAKDKAYIIININDFRKESKFYAYHADTINCLEKAGFIIHDIGILDEIVSGMAKIFAVAFNKKRILPKIHEYLIVAKIEKK